MMTEEDELDEGEVQVMHADIDEEDEEGELSVMSLHGLDAKKKQQLPHSEVERKNPRGSNFVTCG